MFKKLLLLTGLVLFTCTQPGMANYVAFLTWQEVQIGEFTPSEGDYMVANIETGTGYLINESKAVYASFPIISGRKKWVTYIGRRYFAETPVRTWSVESLEIKKDRMTFAKSGRFLRLYVDGDGTPYGIHGYKYFERAIENDTRYISFGCVLVDDEVVDILEESFKASGKNFKVVTTKDESVLPFFVPLI